MGKSPAYLTDQDESELFSADDFESSGEAPEPETRRREPKVPNGYAARQVLDSRKEELWLKQQLNDWDDEFEGADVAD